MGFGENMLVRRIAKKYNDLKIGHKLILIFLIISIIPIILLQIAHFAQTRKNMTEQINKIILNDLVGISQQTNLSLENYTNLLYQIYIDEEIIKQTNVLFNGTETRKAFAKNVIRERLKQYISTMEYVRCISIICANGETVIYDISTDSSLHNLWDKFSDMRIAPPYKDVENSPGMVITPTMKFHEDDRNSYYYHVSKRMFDFDKLDKGSIATVVMTIDEKALDIICSSKEDDLRHRVSFITSEDGKVISYPSKEYIATSVDDFKSLIAESGYLKNSKRIAINEYEDEATGWKFINAYDEDYMLKDLRKSQVYMILISLMILAMVGVIIIYTIRNLNGSVQTIVSGMKKVQNGDLKERISLESKDEFGIIGNNFNLMTERIEQLLNEVSDAKDKQRHAEIRALEAQINPHFLYNTLDSINWMAIDHGENEISKAVSNLGLILRHSVSKTDAETTIAIEADFLRRYLELQSIRYEDAFSYSVIVGHETERLKLHKLLIQPFVENAIIHGFEGMEYGGELTVHFDVSESFDYLQISIEDNGKGFSEELLGKLLDREWILNGEFDGKKGIGLKNAFSRLVIYYGNDAHWTINSVEDIGTEIVLYIPYDLCI